jgi:hypothetical protein
LLREIAPEQDPRRLVCGANRQRVEAAAHHRALYVGYLTGCRRIDPLQRNELLRAIAHDQRLADDDWSCAGDAPYATKLLRLGGGVGNAPGHPDVDVSRRPKDAVSQLSLKTGHEGQGNHQCHHPNRHADRREHRCPTGDQVAKCDEHLERHRFLISGL